MPFCVKLGTLKHSKLGDGEMAHQVKDLLCKHEEQSWGPQKLHDYC